MTETREQFRERIMTVARMSVDRPSQTKITKQQWVDASEAVYAEALHDVMTEFGDLEWETGLDSYITFADELHAWAYNQMGIDLTDEMKALFPDAYDEEKETE